MRGVLGACDDLQVLTTDVPAEQGRRLYRRSEDRVIAGVTSGLADHLGLDVVLVRVIFVILAAAGGTGVAMYALFWVFAPLRPDEGAEPTSKSRDLGPLVALGAVALGVLLLLPILGIGLRPQTALPVFALGFGVVIIWRQADDAQRERLRAVTGATRWSGLTRAAVGVLLVVVGGSAALIGPVNLDGLVGSILAAIVVVVGIGLISSPWWLRMARDLSTERAARIREQERAEVAAHVHDSVLHTLTLIQRNVSDPREVARLARAQERDLRSWLYRPVADPEGTLQSELERTAAEVEDAHGVAVDVVVVGAAALDDGLRALLLAAREALVNAAKYAGDSPISLYAEIEPDQVTVFVRDRGPGFDPEKVPEDRLGLRQSVIGRTERHGGTAIVRSTAGDGTEIQLEMPRVKQ
jgi:signal transduction histidine kinase/phage shock protein PspC (stress-responsive transcriptional regulator)